MSRYDTEWDDSGEAGWKSVVAMTLVGGAAFYAALMWVMPMLYAAFKVNQ